MLPGTSKDCCALHGPGSVCCVNCQAFEALQAQPRGWVTGPPGAACRPSETVYAMLSPSEAEDDPWGPEPSGSPCKQEQASLTLSTHLDDSQEHSTICNSPSVNLTDKDMIAPASNARGAVRKLSVA